MRTSKQRDRITSLKGYGFKVWESVTVKLNNNSYEVVIMVNEKMEIMPVNHLGGSGGLAVQMAMSMTRFS